jgi:hypothetical protein
MVLAPVKRAAVKERADEAEAESAESPDEPAVAKEEG